MNRHHQVAADTPEAAAGRKICEAIAENNGIELSGFESLTWQEAFALASIASILQRVPGTTYTVKRFVFDYAQRIGNAFYFAPSLIQGCLDQLVKRRLIETSDQTDAVLTPVAKKLLIRAAKEIK
jgi:hypothetical protein